MVNYHTIPSRRTYILLDNWFIFKAIKNCVYNNYIASIFWNTPNNNHDYPMNPIVYFEIPSSNPARDINFYQAIFGWTFTPRWRFAYRVLPDRNRKHLGWLTETSCSCTTHPLWSQCFYLFCTGWKFWYNIEEDSWGWWTNCHAQICDSRSLLAGIFSRPRSKYLRSGWSWWKSPIKKINKF